MRGVKVRGVYNTKEEAENKAKTLSRTDSTFNVFVGQVGYWLPWDPCADNVDKEVFQDEQLNLLMEGYEKNNINREIFYEELKQDKVQAAKDEYMAAKKKRLEEENKRAEEKNNEIEDNIYVLPTLGISYLLMRPDMKKEAWEDMKLLRKKIKEIIIK